VAYEPLQVDREGRILDDVPCSGCDHSLKGIVAGALCPDCGETIALSTLGRAVCRADSNGRIDEPVACTTCHHILRGIDPNGVCPECQMPVGPSLEANLLRYSNRHWVKKVADGLLLYVIALGLSVLLGIIGAILMRVLQTNPALVAIIMITISVVSGAFLTLALWWVTSPDPDTPITAQKRLGANLARYSIIPQFICSAGVGALAQVTAGSQNQVLVGLLQIPVGILGMIVAIGMLLHFRQLALRVIDEKLAQWARTILGLNVGGTILAMIGLSVIYGAALLNGGAMPTAGGPPPSGPMLVGMIVGGAAGCVGGLISLTATIWMIVLIFKLRGYFAPAAKAAAERAME